MAQGCVYTPIGNTVNISAGVTANPGIQVPCFAQYQEKQDGIIRIFAVSAASGTVYIGYGSDPDEARQNAEATVNDKVIVVETNTSYYLRFSLGTYFSAWIPVGALVFFTPCNY